MTKTTKEILAIEREAKLIKEATEKENRKTEHYQYRLGYWTGYQEALNEAIRIHRRVIK